MPLEKNGARSSERVLAAAVTIDITPRGLTLLGGYENRVSPASAGADRLEANILSIRGGDSTALIISTDLLYPGELLRAKLLRRLGLSDRPQTLFLCASHTHYAPMTAPDMPLLGQINRDYVLDIAERIAQAVAQIPQPERECLVEYHEGRLNHSVNRRLRHAPLGRRGFTREVGIGPNPDGPRDETARMIRFTTPAGDTIAWIWNYACHVAEFGNANIISPAYPGVVRERLRADSGNVPVLFLQGFSGDLRPPFTGVSVGLKGMARRVLRGPQFRAAQRQEWIEWSGSMAAAVAGFARSSGKILDVRSPRAQRIEVPEDQYALGGKGDKPLFWHLIDCGGFRILGINAEPVIKYRELLEQISPSVPLLTAGCLDQTRGYLPVDYMLPEGGYEVTGFWRLFNFDARFRESVEAPVMGGIGRSLQ